VKCKSVKQK